MAPKKSARPNKKKNKGTKSTSTANNNNDSSASNAHDNHHRSTTAAFTDECYATTFAAGGQSIYATYKQATQRFKEGLLALVPTELLAYCNHDDRIRVQTIMDAVDVLVHRQQTIPSTLLQDCHTSLRFRKRHAKSFVDGGDEGHSYFILVLQYCFTSLQQLGIKTTKKKSKRKSSSQQQQQPAFRFTDLEFDESSDDEKEDSVATTPLIRPAAPEKDYTMDDLVDSIDRCQAILFFTKVDKCMGVVAQQYAAMKQMAVQFRCDPSLGIDDGEYASRLIGPLLTAAAVTNFCIRQVQAMEEEIKFDVPHFTTIYRIMASFALKTEIDDIDQYLKRLGKRVPRTELTAFVGDIVEQGFRRNNDYLEMCERITKEFCKTWDLPFNEEIVSLGRKSLERTLHETGTAAAAHDTLVVPHQWTCGYQYIGGGRCILNTLSMLQELAKSFLRPNTAIKIPIYGELWDEQHFLAKQIQGDTDQLLMEQILPALVFMCDEGPLGMDGVPMLNQLLPLIKHFKKFLKEPLTPVSMSLTFGIHAVLTSIFELQGDNLVANLAKAAENVHRKYFVQRDLWNLTSQRFRDVILPTDNEQIENYKTIPPSMVALTLCGYGETRSKPIRERGVWNPYCAGMILHNISQALNVRFCPFVNVNAQLRITLHLYNAFQLRGLITDIPLLTSLDTYYGKILTIWGSEKATRETILTKFWIAGGWKAEVIRAFHKQCSSFVFGEQTLEEITIRYRDGRYNRRAYEKGCRSEDVSNSYRRICLEDFQGMQRRQDVVVVHDSNWEWYMQFERYIHEIVETMTREEELMSWNLCALGDCLEGLFWYLVDNLGWQDMLDDSEATLGPNDDVAWAKLYGVIQRLLFQVMGPLELIHTVEHDPVVVAVRDLFVEYFQALEPSKYKLFNTLKD